MPYRVNTLASKFKFSHFDAVINGLPVLDTHDLFLKNGPYWNCNNIVIAIVLKMINKINLIKTGVT